ncbi:cupin domain-containing protein [Anaerotignum sp.]|nr:cupin domain-containing protein [Anaerotignum sp.]MBQ7759432.1 cupin domain-containing protein [Anaerotignum sp.]
MEILIGGKLKQLRTEKKLSIAELSRLSDVSTGLISQIERDLVVPSVTSLWRLAKALDTNINYFFHEEPQEEHFITRKGEHRTIVMHNDSSYYKLLHANKDDRSLDMMVITLKSGYTYDRKQITHEGEECGYVLKGTLTLLLNGKDYILNEGDSIYFDSTLPHKYINNGEEDCVSIWAMTPKFF